MNKKHEHNYLTGADGKDYEVSEKIFREYKHSVWNEEAQIKREHSVIRDKSINKSDLDKMEYIKVVSLESIIAGGGEYHIGVTPDFADELVDALEKKENLELLRQALKILDESEKEMIGHLLAENINQQKYGRKYDKSRKAVAYRKNKIIGKLKDFINNKR